MHPRPIGSAGVPHPVFGVPVRESEARASGDSPAQGVATVTSLTEARRALTDEEGSVVTEYGLLAVVAATLASVVIAWASNGALISLFNALLDHARSLVGA